MAAPHFYFAWVDPTDGTWSETFARDDEAVFSVSIQHAEGEFPAAEVELINPKIGLLAPSRKQWAWISYRRVNGTITPLFFGRLVGVPQELTSSVVKVSFVARRPDFEATKEALAETMRVTPYYDAMWLSEEDREDPDRVLEGYSRLWHIDRVTGAVTASDILTGEDGIINFGEAQVFRDSVTVGFSNTPATRCVVNASVAWTEVGSGTLDITHMVLRAFEEAGPPEGLIALDDSPRDGAGMINIALGDALVEAWPEPGDGFGGGWSVGVGTEATVVGDPPLPPILAGQAEGTPQDPNFVGLKGLMYGSFNSAWNAIQNWEAFPDSGGEMIRQIFDRSPGFVVGLVDYTKPIPPNGLRNKGYTVGRNLVHGDVLVLWVPVWQIAPTLTLQWEASRERGETLSFTVNADVQPLLADAGDEDTVEISIGPVKADPFMADVRSPRYFDTGRGRVSVEHLLARARALLLARARAVDITFSVAFEEGLALSCRKSASITDYRLPGGVAAGKVKSYVLAANGENGELVASVTIACSLGRGGEVVTAPGAPDYCVADYVGSDYQEFVGQVLVPFAGDLGYTLPSGYSIADDGVRLRSINIGKYVESVTVSGGLDEQIERVRLPYGGRDGPPLPIDKEKRKAYDSAASAMSDIVSVNTSIRVQTKPVLGGPFLSVVYPEVTDLKVPRTINLEA